MSNLRDDAKKAINKAIDFLYQNQLGDGEFRTFASWNPWMLPSFFDSSPFVTTFVLYSLKDVKDKRVEIMKKKAIEFLLREKEKGGIWKFWTSKNRKKLPPDLDDISTISFVLKINNIDFEDNTQLILNNKNKDNLFLTWLKGWKNNTTWWVKPWISKEDVDCVVNANVLLYLGKNDPDVCPFINRVIRSGKPRTIYYPHKLALYYMVSRAYQNNVRLLGKEREMIIKSTLKLQKKNGSFGNSLKNALALNSLFNFNYYGRETELGIDFLLKSQSANGSWKKEVLFLGPFPYLFYGSEELTTALVIESLKNYLQKL